MWRRSVRHGGWFRNNLRHEYTNRRSKLSRVESRRVVVKSCTALACYTNVNGDLPMMFEDLKVCLYTLRRVTLLGCWWMANAYTWIVSPTHSFTFSVNARIVRQSMCSPSSATYKASITSIRAYITSTISSQGHTIETSPVFRVWPAFIAPNGFILWVKIKVYPNSISEANFPQRIANWIVVNDFVLNDNRLKSRFSFQIFKSTFNTW